MADWIIYLFIAFLLLSYALLARVCYTQGREARWIGEKLPGMLAFTLAVTAGSLGVDIGRHGFDYLVENPSVIVMRILIVLVLQAVPYAIGYWAGRKQRGSGIIGMD